jgi:hypothetical protein
MKSALLLIVILISCSLVLSGCVPGGERFQKDSPAGFFMGIWHGWIAPVTLILGFFNNEIRMYEPQNTGWWYDFGFYIALIGGFGGIAFTRKKLQDHRK